MPKAQKGMQRMRPDIGFRILLIGISTRAFAESAVRSNYPVVAMDAFGDEDLRSFATCYSLPHDFHLQYSPAALWDISRQIHFDAVAFTANLENYPEILSRFETEHMVAGNSSEVVRAVRNWPELFMRLQAAGFRVPETILWHRTPYGNGERRWLRKPVKSGGGHGVCFHKGILSSGDSMLQEHIPGKACSAAFIANGSKSVLLGIAEQLIGQHPFGAGGFRYCGNILPLPETLDPDSGPAVVKRVREIMEFLVREYGLTGINGFDFILNHGEIYLIEVNPRYSASMELVERAYNLPIFHLHMEAVTSRKLPGFVLESRLNGDYFFGKSILFCEQNAVWPGRPDLPGCELRDIPVPGLTLHKGSPVCTILASRDTYAETYGELIRQAGLLKAQLYG